MAIKKIDSFNKHQNPSTNQNPFDIENYLNVNWNKAQDVINNNADELKTAQNNISEIKQEQITQNTDIEKIKNKNEFQDKDIENLQQKNIQLQEELEQTKTNLENYAIHGKSTGEYIHLTDSSETDCKVDVKGNSKQATREGYNELLQNRRTNTTTKGITVVYNEDGTIKASGTATDNTDIPLCGQWDSTVVQFVLKKGTHRLDLWTNVPTLFLVKGTSAKSLSNQKDLVLTEDYEVTNAFLRIAKGASINATIKPLLYLYEGQDKPYEQYGAMPSLDYPSKIETVGSNKNVFNDEKVKGLIVTTESMKNTELMDISLANNKYYIARIWFEDGTYATGNNFMLYGYNSSNQNIASIPNGQAKIHTNATEIAKIRIVTNITGIETYENKKIKGIKIEETDENGIATSYSSFGQGSVKVTSCNKNLLDMEKDVFIEKYGLTVKTDKNNELTLNGKSTNATFIKLYGEEMVVHTNVAGWKTKKIKKGTYTLSISKTGETSDNNINLLVRQGKDTTESNTITQIAQIGSKTTASSKFEIKEDTEIAIWLWLNTNNTLNDFKLKVQLERGDKAIEIIGNQEDSVVLTIQEEMCALKVHENNQNYNYIAKDGTKYICDEIIKKNNKYYYRKCIDSLDTTSAKSAMVRTATNNVSINYFVEDLLHSAWNVMTSFAMCNKFKQCTPSLIDKENSFAIWNGNKNIAITIDNSCLEDVSTNEKALESWNKLIKKWEAEGTALKLIYCRENPKDIEITSSDTIQALEKLDKLKTYKNITNITTDSIAMLDVDYKKDLETVLSQITKESEA